MKYIVFDDGANEMPVLFPSMLVHKLVARHLQTYVTMDGHLEPISAGFWDGKVCSGESESLKLKSRPEDSDLIQRFLR